MQTTDLSDMLYSVADLAFLIWLGILYELILIFLKLDIKCIIFLIKPRHSYNFELYFF
jgi:hypothetical protein